MNLQRNWTVTLINLFYLNTQTNANMPFCNGNRQHRLSADCQVHLPKHICFIYLDFGRELRFESLETSKHYVKLFLTSLVEDRCSCRPRPCHWLLAPHHTTPRPEPHENERSELPPTPQPQETKPDITRPFAHSPLPRRSLRRRRQESQAEGNRASSTPPRTRPCPPRHCSSGRRRRRVRLFRLAGARPHQRRRRSARLLPPPPWPSSLGFASSPLSHGVLSP
jgi:hypothetical protein